MSEERLFEREDFETQDAFENYRKAIWEQMVDEAMSRISLRIFGKKLVSSAGVAPAPEPGSVREAQEREIERLLREGRLPPSH